jgi:hypothetical protein
MDSSPNNRLQILQNRINQYDMRFPVATIVKETGLNKGYVSAVLNGKKPISDNFWDTFDKKFPEKFKEDKKADPPPLADLLTQLMQKQNQLMEMQNKILETQKEDLIDKVKEIHANSKSALSYLQVILRATRADDGVIMDNQDEQAGREAGSSARQAGNLEIAAAQQEQQTDKKKQDGVRK